MSEKQYEGRSNKIRTGPDMMGKKNEGSRSLFQDYKPYKRSVMRDSLQICVNLQIQFDFRNKSGHITVRYCGLEFPFCGRKWICFEK